MTNITYQFNIGIDIAKQKFDVSFSDQKVVSFENNLDGFKQLLKEIKDKPQTRVVMEATGGSPAGEGACHCCNLLFLLSRKVVSPITFRP